MNESGVMSNMHGSCLPPGSVGGTRRHSACESSIPEFFFSFNFEWRERSGVLRLFFNAKQRPECSSSEDFVKSSEPVFRN